MRGCLLSLLLAFAASLRADSASIRGLGRPGAPAPRGVARRGVAGGEGDGVSKESRLAIIAMPRIFGCRRTSCATMLWNSTRAPDPGRGRRRTRVEHSTHEYCA